MHVSLTEQMNGCPIREGENTGNIVGPVANTKKNFSTDNVIYMFLFLLIQEDLGVVICHNQVDTFHTPEEAVAGAAIFIYEQYWGVEK